MTSSYRKISKFIKRTLLILIVFLIVVGIIGTSLFVVYEDRIMEMTIEQVNEQLTVPVSVGQINLNAWRYFPSMSLVLSDVVIEGSSPELSPDTLLSAQKIFIQFNLFKLLKGAYHLENISIESAKADLVIFKNGKTNFRIWKEPDNTGFGTFSMDLQKVIFDDVEFSYKNLQNDDLCFLFFHHVWIKANFSNVGFQMDLSGDIRSRILQTGGRSFLNDRFLQVDLNMAVNHQKGHYSINKGVVRSGKLRMDVSGEILLKDTQKYFDLTVTSKKSPLQAYLNVIPEDFRSKIGDFTGTGELSLDISVKGNIDKEQLPEININYNLINGILISKTNGFKLKEIILSGDFISSVAGVPGEDQLQVNRFSARSLAGQIEGKLSVKGFNHPQISLEIFSELDLGKLQDVIQINALSFLTGKAEIDAVFNGRINDINHLTPQDFINNTISGAFKIQNSEFRIRNNGLEYKEINGVMTIENNDIAIENLSGYISKSDFKLKGYFRNALSWLFIPGQELIVDAGFVSGNLYLDELLTYQKSTDKIEYKLALPKNLRCFLDVNINYFEFKTFRATNISGTVQYRDQVLKIDPLQLNAMQGEVKAAGTLDGRIENRLLLKCNATLNDVNIRDLFYGFGDFGQEGMTHKNINGSLTSSLYYSATMRSDLKSDLNSIYTLANLYIEEGELLQYKPLIKLSKFLKLEEVKHIRFSKLENMIEIKQKRIIIPEMEINSNTIDISIFGEHDFDNNIDYHLKLLLSDVLTAKFKRGKNSDEEFGVVEEDGLGRTTLFLKIGGTTENPEFGYDTKELKEKIKSDLKDEKQDLKEAMQEEFQWLIKDSVEKAKKLHEKEIQQRLENGEFIYEWEEDDIPVDSSKKKIEKIKGSEFKIEWEEDTLRLRSVN